MTVLSRGRGYTLYLTPTEAVIALSKAAEKGTKARESIGAAAEPQSAEQAVRVSTTCRGRLLSRREPAPEPMELQPWVNKSETS